MTLPGPLTTAGWISFSLDVPTVFPTEIYPPPGPREMRLSNEGRYFTGLPVIGFAVQNLVNNNVQNGVLANYSSAVAHRVTTNCYMPLNDNLQPVPCR